MARVKVSFEVNKKVYDRMDEICEALGMTPEDAFEIFAHRMVNEQEMPFQIEKEDYPKSDHAEQIRAVLLIAAAVAGIGALISILGSFFHLFRRR